MRRVTVARSGLLIVGGLGAFGALYAGCQSFTPVPYDGEFHSRFALEGTAHEDITCEGCHEGGAQQQGLVSQVEGSTWVIVVSQTCADCHPFTAYLDPADVCAPNDPREHCRFVDVHPNPAAVQNCEQSGCHSRTDESWSAIGGGPSGITHDDEPLASIFPTQGVHDVLCQECHDDATNYALEVGKGEYCANCHTRAGEAAGAEIASGSGLLTHYVPARPTTDERERDCRACHTALNIDGSTTWPQTWDEVTTFHSFLVPHNTVEAWGQVPAVVQDEASWKRQCWSCHNGFPANPVDGPTTQDGPLPAQIYLQTSHVTQGTFQRNLACTNGCHQGLSLPTDVPPGPPAHAATDPTPCTNCHEQAGPADTETPPYP